MPIETADEVLEALRAGQFHALVGLRESVWLEAKQMPYVFDTQKQELELAKDVSAMANASGGIIVVGFKTERRADVAGEYISEIIPFPASLVDSDRYMKLLEQLVYPSPHGVDVLTFESPVEPGKAVAAILVNGAATNERPYLVGSMVDEQEQSIGAYFGFFERRQDVIPTLRIARIQQQLSVGLSLDARLSGIETAIASLKAPYLLEEKAGITEEESTKRLAEARAALGRDPEPLVYFTAAAEGECDFPALFSSRRARIVRLLENPPQLRPDGFEISADRTAGILGGRLRRNMIPGYKLLELWKDGFFVYIAPGDEDFLGWSVGNTTGKAIRISSFVLAEATLAFCWLTQVVFQEANPKPQAVKLCIGLDNLTRPAGPAALSKAAEGPRLLPGTTRPAPNRQHRVCQLAALADYDAERLAYQLIEQIYNWFGYDSEDLPYVERGNGIQKISANRLTGSPLPLETQTPDYS